MNSMNPVYIIGKQISKRLIALFFFIVSFSCLFAQKSLPDLTGYVDPFIGTEGHGHVFLGANVPFGAVQLGPSNIMQTWDKFNGWDWCSGYNYISKEILGFTHTHLSGTGIGDLNDILLLPANGLVQITPAKFGDMNSGYGSYFSHNNEVCKPGYYKVYLDKYKVKAELTTTERVGFHQYTFDQKESNHLLVDLSFGMGWDAVVKSAIEKINDTTFVGYRYSTGWAEDQRIYFAIRLSQPVIRAAIYDSTTIQENLTNVSGKRIKAALFFGALKQSVLKVKVGISSVSTKNALENIDAELPHWNFLSVVKSAKAKWNKTLQRVVINASDSVKTKFYTALYHSLLFPSIFNDVNGDYYGADYKLHHAKDFTNYTVLSLWDTYRGIHPLMTILQPERVNDYVKTFLNIYKQQGKLPVWHLHGNETNTMIGYPAVPIIVDAFLKGLREYDVELAYAAIKHSAMQDSEGINYVQKKEFIPADSVSESVAKGLEYAISDWGVAQMAKALKKEEDYHYFSDRAKLYKHYFDTSTNFMRGRLDKHTWRVPFDPVSAVHRANDYCEGNAWQYSWLVPHDVNGLIQLYGGKKFFIQKLDSLFSISSALDKNASPDISGLIGQYAHGNEPNHHIPYLYTYAGQPYKTAELIRKITGTFYTQKKDGLCGNDDVGEMSAWYVFAALGFYPVNPMGGEFVLGSPLINDAAITIKNKVFTIKVVNNSDKNIYINKVLLNGKERSSFYLTYSDISLGGKLEIFMSDKPSKKWGVLQKISSK